MEERTGKTPKPLLEIPEMDSFDSWYIKAFNMLSDSRVIGERGAGHIPLSEITDYSNHFDLIDDLEMFVTVIRRMDNEYVKSTNKKIEASQKASMNTSTK